MIQIFVDRFMNKKTEIRAALSVKALGEYSDLVAVVVSAIRNEDDYGDPDPERIHEIDDGGYQGTLLYVIAAKGYQPCDYWYVKIAYGSCSGCDALEAIRGYSSEPPTAEQLDDYMTLALHIVQGIKKLGGEAV